MAFALFLAIRLSRMVDVAGFTSNVAVPGLKVDWDEVFGTLADWSNPLLTLSVAGTHRQEPSFETGVSMRP